MTTTHSLEPIASRPQMVDGYGLPADEDGLLSWSWAVEQLTAARNYWIATASSDRRPRVRPVWGLWFDDAVVFSTGRTTRMGRNLLAGSWTVAHLESGDDVVIVEGQPVAFTDPERLRVFVDAYAAKYDFRFDPHDATMNAGVYMLRPRVAFGWLERDFTRTATRWTFASTP